MSLARAPKSSCAELLVGSSLCIDGVWLEVRSGWRLFSISIGTRATSGSSSKSENEDRCIALRPDAGRGAGTSAPGETPNNILRRELDIEESPAQPIAVIEFHIPAGTGSNPWNTRDTAVKGVVGQTLRIYNDDNVPHRLHTSGAPFLHAANDTLPSTFSDVVLAQPFNLDTPAGVYDHNFGQIARFWISVQAAT